MDVYTAPGVLLSLGNIALLLPALYLALKITKERPFNTLTSSRGGWNMSFFKKALLISLVINALPQIILSAIDGGFSHLNFQYTVPGFIIFVLLLPVQCIAEEYLFRAFAGQTFGSWFKLPIVAMILSTFLFMIMHGYNSFGQIVVFVTGMCLAFVVWYTKGVEAGCAFHTVNNFFAFLLSGIGATPISGNTSTRDMIIDIVINLVFASLVILLNKKKNWFAT